MKKHSALIACLALLSAACTGRPENSSVASAGVVTGNLRGITAVENQIRDTMVASSNFSLEVVVPGLSSLRGYMGAINPLTNQVDNSRPNGMNMMLWDITMTNVAAQVGQYCGDGSTLLPLNASTVDAVKAACLANALNGDQDETVVSNLWFALMGFQAPDSEYDLFKKVFYGPEKLQFDTANARVAAMSRYVFLNPYYLLEQ